MGFSSFDSVLKGRGFFVLEFALVSLKHLQRYLNEFAFRFNNRKAADLFGMTVQRMALAGNSPYAKLVACRSEFVTADAAGGVRVFPLDRASIGGVGVDVAAKFAS
jgi:hypothetical protein